MPITAAAGERFAVAGSAEVIVQDYTGSGQQVQRLVLAIAGVRWPYTPDVLPPHHHQ